MATKQFTLNNIILFLVYVALALTVLRFRPEISDMTGLSQNAILWVALGIFLAIALGSLLMRKRQG